MICADRLDSVFAVAARAVETVSTSPAHRALHDQALRVARDKGEGSSMFVPIDLPIAVADVLGRPRAEQDAVAAACTLLWSGADLLDDIADGQLPEAWRDTTPHQLTLVAVNLLATLPHLVPHLIPMAAVEAQARFSRAIATTLWRMSEGQMLDLSSPVVVESYEDYFQLVEGKSGAEMALFAAAPAMLAGLPPAVCDQWSAFGERIGVMIQTFSDIASTFADSDANDLLRGKRSIPVLFALQQLTGVERERFQADLERAAQGERAAVGQAIEIMRRLGAARAGLMYVEQQRFRAAKALPINVGEFPIDHQIRGVLGACSVV